MLIHDLTLLLNQDTEPFDPSTEPRLSWQHCVDHSFFKCQVSLFSMVSHMGTHVDAPLHYIPKGKTTSQVDLSAYCGEATCIDVTAYTNGPEIDLTEALEKNQELIKPGMLLLLYTGWGEIANTREFFTFPDLAENSGALLEQYGVKGIGVDMPSVDNAGKTHVEILGRDIGIFESVINLKPLVGKKFFFSAVPLKFEDGDGSPVRAYAITKD